MTESNLLGHVFSKQKRSLLRQLVITDFKLRYQGSMLGYLWSIVRPLALFTVLYFVFSHIFRFGDSIPAYPAYLLLGIVVWTFFVEATNMGMQSIVGRGDLIRKVTIPKWTIVLSTSFTAFINFGINLIVAMIFAIPLGTQLIEGIWILPLLIIELFVLAVGVSFLLAALYVRFRDMAFIWELILQVAFYATPIIYPLSLVPERFQKIMLFNPVAQIIQDARYVLVTPKTTTAPQVLGAYSFVPIVIVLSLAILAALYFRKASRDFAENV